MVPVKLVYTAAWPKSRSCSTEVCFILTWPKWVIAVPKQAFWTCMHQQLCLQKYGTMKLTWRRTVELTIQRNLVNMFWPSVMRHSYCWCWSITLSIGTARSRKKQRRYVWGVDCHYSIIARLSSNTTNIYQTNNMWTAEDEREHVVSDWTGELIVFNTD